MDNNTINAELTRLSEEFRKQIEKVDFDADTAVKIEIIDFSVKTVGKNLARSKVVCKPNSEGQIECKLISV